MEVRIPFNKPHIVGAEIEYVRDAVLRGNIAGDGDYTQACSGILEERYGIPRVLLTPSCTAALEISAWLLDVGPGDEVILPSYTFVSTANAFLRTGARLVFVDVRADTLNLDEGLLEASITPRTKAACVVHYAGVGCEMDAMLEIAGRHGVRVIEDAAQGVHASYRGRPLGSIAPIGCFSFHATKNYTCGEGGAVCINDEALIERAEILREKGTDRSRFLRGEVDKYTWVDVGSSYVPSELASAFLYGQLEHLDGIADARRAIHARYAQLLRDLETRGCVRLPVIPEHCESNCHMFYILLENGETRDALLRHLRDRGIVAAFHYVPLHDSPMGRSLGYRRGDLPVTEEISARILRLPFYADLNVEDQEAVVAEIEAFFAKPGFSVTRTPGKAPGSR